MSLVELIDRLDESIGAGASAATLRAQLSVIREQVEAVEAQLQEAKARIKELEARAQSQDRDTEDEKLEEAAKKLLQLLFNAGGHGYIEKMATKLGLAKSMADYHADILSEAGMVELVAAGSSGTMYVLTPKGRAYIVENKLV